MRIDCSLKVKNGLLMLQIYLILAIYISLKFSSFFEILAVNTLHFIVIEFNFLTIEYN